MTELCSSSHMCRQFFRLNNALELDHPVFVPTSIEGIFEAITTVSLIFFLSYMSTTKVVEFFKVETPPYYVLMNYVMRGAWDEAIGWMHAYCKKMGRNSGTNFLSLYRFFGLIASVCRIMKYEHNVSTDSLCSSAHHRMKTMVIPGPLWEEPCWTYD